MQANMQVILDDWAARVRAAAQGGGRLCLRGGGSKDFYGGAPTGDILDTRPYCGIVSHEASELVAVVRAGTPLAELEAALAAQGQCLAFEPPHFAASGAQATVGGAVAAGLAGPRRASAGALRDHVLGVRLLDGRGSLLSFGGAVMKNVAGYDVPRLVAGSLGTLGIICEVTLKVLPAPRHSLTLRQEASEPAAIERLNAWGGQPLPLSASCWHDGVLTLRLSGAAAALAAAEKRLGGERLDEAAAARFWQSLREQTHPFFAGDAPLWRLSLAATAAPAGPGPRLIEWGGALRWQRGSAENAADEASALRRLAHAAGGHATLFRAAAAIKAEVGAFQPLAPGVMRLHQRLKAAFDPQGVFNCGRLYADF